MSKISILPDRVPILDESDICKYELRKGEQRCLLGWLTWTFSAKLLAEDPAEYDLRLEKYLEVRALLVKEINKEVSPTSRMHDSITTFNDSWSISKSLIARVWNRTMKKLGYVVPCDRPNH